MIVSLLMKKTDFTGHKRITSLEPYNPKAKFAKKMEVAMTLCLQPGVPSTSNGPQNLPVVPGPSNSNGPQNLPVVPVPSTSNGPQNLPVIRPNVRELPAKATVENRSQIGDVRPADSTFDEDSGIDYAQIEYEGMYVNTAS